MLVQLSNSRRAAPSRSVYRRGVGSLSDGLASSWNIFLTDLGLSSDPGSVAVDTIRNMLPVWAGGSPITDSQLADIQSQAAAAITQAATSPTTGQVNTQLLQQAIAQMQKETTAVANQQRNAAKGQDTNLLWWAAGGVLAVVVLVTVLQ